MAKKTPRKKLEDKLDKIFSLIIRLKGHCVRCGKSEGIQCSHIHSRSKMSVRWDLYNAFCLCAGCHLYWWHKHPIEAGKFTLSILGQSEFDKLYDRAMFTKKWTVEEMQEHLKFLEGIYNARRNN